jgi:BirA family biotin operon repressor/biotin-[acetyl-CoA-carboxylase] ligase
MKVPEALFTGKNKISFPELESTNNYALEWIAKTNPSEGSCVIADFQTAGRGQIGRYWHSEADKNILISYIFYPKSISIQEQFFLNIISGLAVFDVVSAFCENVKIKWPNDVYVNDKKIAGILVQNVLRGHSIKATVIGIGLNVNQSEFPKEIPNPTSLINEFQNELAIFEVISLLSARIEFHYLRLQRGNFKELTNDYLQNLYRLNLWATFSDEDGSQFEGKITGIEAQGKLLIQPRDESIKSFGFREISYII